MRAAIYLRVSSAGQEDNWSLATQEDSCRAYAAAKGWAVAAVYRDVHTGAEVFERPGLTQLRAEMRAGAFDVLLVHALDRLSRDQNHQGLVLSEAEHAGVLWDSATEDIDDSPTGKILRAVIGGMAELERLKIMERTQRGKRARVAAGKYNPGQKAPYGYVWVDPVTKERLAIDPLTSPIVERIFNGIAGGGSARGTALELNRDGVPTPTGRGKDWYATTISIIVNHPVYVGEARAYRWTVEKERGGRKRVRPQSEETHVVLPGVAPAIVTPEIAAAARERLGRNRQEATRNNKNPEDALLRAGYARCGYCGRPMTITRHRQTNRVVYRCNPGNRDRFGCPHFGINADILDSAVMGRVEEVLTRPEIIAVELERLRRDDPTAADLDAVETRLEAIERQRGNLTRKLALFDDDKAAAPLIAEIGSLTEQLRALHREREALEAQRHGWVQAQEQLADLERWCRIQSTNLGLLTYEQKRLALFALGAEVRVWSTDHDPRYEISIRLEVANPDIAKTTARRSTTATWRPRRRGSTG